MSKFDVRHNGSFIARHADEDAAQKHAASLGEDFSVEPGRAFELSCEDGFIDSYDSLEQAKAAQGRFARFKKFSIKTSDGEAIEETAALSEEPSEAPTDPAPPEPEQPSA